MLYQMYERGMVKSLDDPLSNYCPGFSIRNPYDSSKITLRQMAAQVCLNSSSLLRILLN